jgi:hypothetical protein
MYTQADLMRADASFRKFIALFLLAAAAPAGLFVFSVRARIEWLAYASAAWMPLALIFIWGNYGVRIAAHRRFLHDMLAGLEKEASGTIAAIDKVDTQRDGLEFRAFHLMTGEDSDKAGGRLLYIESGMLPLPAGPGQKVSCRTFGGYVKDIKVLEGE